MKRSIWFLAGATAGLLTRFYVEKKIKNTTLKKVSKRAANNLKAKLQDAKNTIIDLKEQANNLRIQKEIELKTRLDLNN
jgi:type IV secretory pathway VirD2 relaxase